jgi:hypothetical protein
MGRRSVVLAVVVIAASSAFQVGADAKNSHPNATSTCAVASGYADYNRAPRSVSDLVEQSDAVIGLRARGEEKLALQQSSGSTISFLMRAPVRVEEVVKGDFEPTTAIDLHRVVIGHDLEGALAQSRCMVGAAQRLVSGSHYFIGLVQDDEGRWFAASGSYSTIPLRERGGRLVAVADCPVDTSDCQDFPYTLAGQSYRSIVREARAAA